LVPDDRQHSLPLIAGVFAISAATLMYEVLLTRIFSVTMWYHCAFFAISAAMFGAAAGAAIVYAAPRVFTSERALPALIWASLAFGVSVPLTLGLHLRLAEWLLGMSRLSTALPGFATATPPFVLSGIAICIALTKLPVRTSSIYASDLAGASLGCVAIVLLLRYVDGPTAAFLIGTLAVAAAMLFALEANGRIRAVTAAALVATVAVSIGAVSMSRSGAPLVRIRAAKGAVERPALWEQWNSFSRIRVEGDPEKIRHPFGWGLSPRAGHAEARELTINIDAASGTVLTRFDGDLGAVDYLKYDVTNLVHWLRPSSDVLIIGTGGGRDVLSALAFRQARITGIEINEAILRAANGAYGDFTGHLDRIPNVRFINDEARSYLERSPDRHDVILITLIDTWAATAAGAFALTENSLYTAEAWDLFLRRLSDHGVLAVSRWYRHPLPYETWRMLALATEALRRRGVTNPRAHLILAKSRSTDSDRGVDVATLLVSRAPFTASDLSTFDRVTTDLAFEAVVTPAAASNSVVEAIANGDAASVMASLPADISTPTDDRPFFFSNFRFSKILPLPQRNSPAAPANSGVLLGLAGATTLCTIAGIFAPMKVADSGRRPPLRLLIFFAAIGLGFMFIEIGQMQRFSLFLGHPTLSMVVALPTLLLGSGIGSMLAGRLARPERHAAILAALFAVVGIAGLATPFVLRAAGSASIAERVGLCVVVLAAPALFMGMAFPIGAQGARNDGAILPWLWAVNGAASVCASVVAMILSTAAGISVTVSAGCAMYAIAFLAYRSHLTVRS
jgi:hypothetical protein